ncbi:conserved hypothetical protein [Formosa agariphila KMM 3901]|uniref:Uncharacterized protein n=1 Tax=Formosa agariphila (strain DSM 15362 / KCTC 12365 / LMG 23005 / KMM 3901 / M-2Alg 35-1) TaxID=1347342 RepID=T2KJC9_FORAG|nr:hypothetical protein [Formosa agariphila]CDF78094.1 conserved hypothetical protein [Formosa agariphila KMM 3901]
MASNNFENKIKASLEERRLQPSSNSWDKLQSQLDAPQKKKNSKRYWVMAIAASFIGVLLFSALFFNSNSTTDLPVVNTETISNTTTVVDTDSLGNDEAITEVEELQKIHIVESVSDDSVVNQLKKTVNTKALKLNSDTNEVAEIQNKMKSALQDSVSEIEDNSSLVAQESIATEDYIENLLQQAEQDVLADKSIKQAQQTVDAEKLLEHVENDIEHGFRETVFDAVKSGFKKVKTAVVERNN